MEKKTRDVFAFLTSPLFLGCGAVFYFAILLLLLLSELGVPGLSWLRATNQVLILLALLFLPFLLLASPRMVRSVTLKLSGQEVHLELSELKRTVEKQFRRVESSFTGQVSSAEQALWPILAGMDPNRQRRWAAKQLVIGSKQDISHVFFVHFLSEWLQHKVSGLQCIPRLPNGGSLKNFADLRYGWIDLYVDFTGTSCQYFSIDSKHKSAETNIQQLNDFTRPLGIEYLPPLGATENYLLVMKTSVAATYGISTIKDLTWSANKLVFTADPEFLNRRDCFLGMAAAYDLKFRRVEPCKITERYAMLESGEVDVFVGYETDPELKSPELLALRDTDGFFPEYHALPVASLPMLDQVTGVKEALLKLQNQVTTDDLIEMVHKIRLRGQSPSTARDLAREFIAAKKLA